MQPDTVVRSHRRAFKIYWPRKSQVGRPERPALESGVTALILKMADTHPLWEAPKIYGELLKPGIGVSERAVREIAEAFPSNTAPTYSLHDRDSIYGGGRRHARSMGAKESKLVSKEPGTVRTGEPNSHVTCSQTIQALRTARRSEFSH